MRPFSFPGLKTAQKSAPDPLGTEASRMKSGKAREGGREAPEFGALQYETRGLEFVAKS